MSPRSTPSKRHVAPSSSGLPRWRFRDGVLAVAAITIEDTIIRYFLIRQCRSPTLLSPNMAKANSTQPLELSQADLNALYALSLKRYRFLTCRHLSMLFYPSQDACYQRIQELRQTGLVTRLFIPTTDEEKREVVYTLARPGARELARLKGINLLGLASARKPSYLFLEHSLSISDFMCSLEAALKKSRVQLLFWKSDRQLKTSRGRALSVPHPFELGEKIPVIPDGLFSLEICDRVEYFFLEADRGTMSLFAMRKKLLGYVQLYLKGLHRRYFGIPHFRVLLVTNTPRRRDKLRETLHEIGYCPNMFWFAVWRDISPEKILSKIWFKCRDQVSYSLVG